MARPLARNTAAGVTISIVCHMLLPTAWAVTPSLSSVSGGSTRYGDALNSAAAVAFSTSIFPSTKSFHAGSDLPASWPDASATTVTAGTATAKQDSCQLQGDRSYEPVPAAISAVLAASGFVMLLAGYRLYRLSFLVGGILLGSAVSYVALTECRAVPTLGIEATVCIVVGVGAILGVCTALIPIVGHVLLAATCGSALALTIFTVVATFLGLLPVTVVAGATAAVGLVAGFMAAASLRRPRHQAFATVVCTSAAGSILMLVCVDYFLEHYLLLSSMYRVLRGPADREVVVARTGPTSGPLSEISATAGVTHSTTAALYAIVTEEVQRLRGSSAEGFGAESLWQREQQLPVLCFYTWITLAVWPLLTAAGSLVQWNVTAKQEVDSFTGLWCKTKSSRRASLVKSRGGDLESETAWRRFRNIYSARRSAGDVVATAYTKGSKKFSSIRRTPLHSETDDDACLNTAKSSFKV